MKYLCIRFFSGGAFGFALGSLSKLKDTVSQKKSSNFSLMDFIVQEFHSVVNHKHAGLHALVPYRKDLLHYNDLMSPFMQKGKQDCLRLVDSWGYGV